MGIPPHMLSEVMCISLAQGDQRNTSHTRCTITSERRIQDLGSSQTDNLQTSALKITDPYERFTMAAPAMLPISIADLITCSHF